MTTSEFINQLESIKKITSTIYLYHTNKNTISVVLNSVALNPYIETINCIEERATIYKNHLGIWELEYNPYKTDYPLNLREINLIKKEIKNLNLYECRYIKNVFKKNNTKDISKYSQLSMF